MRISQKQKKIRNLDLEEIWMKVTLQNTVYLTELNIDQLMHGVTAKGQKVSPSYALEWYAQMKNRMNPSPGWGTPDLRLTGEFHSSFDILEQSGTLAFYSDSDDKEKSTWLISHYGREIFGLSPENKEKFVKEKFRKQYMAAVKVAIGTGTLSFTV